MPILNTQAELEVLHQGIDSILHVLSLHDTKASANYNFMCSSAEFDHESNSKLDDMFNLQNHNSGPTDVGRGNANESANGTSSDDQNKDEFHTWLSDTMAPFGTGHFDEHQFALRVGQYDNVTRDRTVHRERMQTNYYNRPTGRSTFLGLVSAGINGFAALSGWVNKPHVVPQELPSQSVLGKRAASGSGPIDRDHEPSAKRIRDADGGFINVTGPGTDFDFEDDMVYIKSQGTATDYNTNTNTNYQARRGQNALNRAKKSAVRKIKRTWNN